MEQLNTLPPHSTDIEQAVLGAILIEPGTDIEIIDILSPEMFYDQKHQKIFKAIVKLSAADKPVDTLTVIKQLEQDGTLEEVGGAIYITELAQKVGTTAHLKYHASVVYEKYILRRLIDFANNIQKMAYSQENEIETILDKAEKELFDIASDNIKNEIRPIAEVIKEALDKMEEIGQKDITLSGIPSGFTELDRITSGWQNSDLIIVAARPSMGKTSFILSMARNMAVDYGLNVAIFSLEMSAMQLVHRLISSEAEISSGKIKTGKLSQEEWIKLEKRIKPLENAHIFIDDTAAISLFELRAKARRLKIQHNIDIIFIDYLQLMTGPPETKGNREQEVSHISRGLKALAKELNIPVIALSQLNRAVEHRSGAKRPQLSDLRESGAIEQDADIVIFIHRPEKFGITEIDGKSTEGLAEIIIAKHRNGPVTDIPLRFIDKYAKFVNYTDAFIENDEDELIIDSNINTDDDDEIIDFPNTEFEDVF